MSQSGRARAGTVLLVLAAVIVVGVPLLAYIWETLNRLLAGHAEGGRLAITAPLILVFIGLLVLAGRSLGRLAAPPAGGGAPPAGGEPEPIVAGTLFLTALVAMVMFAIWVIVYSYLLER